MKTEPKQDSDSQAEVDLGDEDIDAGMNWNAPNPFHEIEKNGFRYYEAVDRPGVGGTVDECKALGYIVDVAEKSRASGHVLMKMPLAEYRRRQKTEQRMTKLMEGEALWPSGLAGSVAAPDSGPHGMERRQSK